MTVTILECDSQQYSSQENIVGDSPAIANLRSIILRVGLSSASVLICGPSGSGKELVARALHDASKRSNENFVALNCGAIPTELIESELFGHERGSFTGAMTKRVGRFEQADQGTLFLDEIGDMRGDMQVKLLRVLEDSSISRVGSNKQLPVNVRIISATHQDIDDAIADNRFRADLFFRLGVFVLHVPSLAERRQDIPALITHFQKNKPPCDRTYFDDSAIARLQMHDWPGNVRELRNIVERATIIFGNQHIQAADIETLLGHTSYSINQLGPLMVENDDKVAPSPFCSEALLTNVPPPGGNGSDDDVANDGRPIDLKLLLEQIERERIEQALANGRGVTAEAARLLGLKRTTLIEKMRKYGVARSC